MCALRIVTDMSARAGLAGGPPQVWAGPRRLVRYAWLAIATALATMALKTVAWLVTDSVGFLSDAAESLVNLVAAVVALVVLRVIARPADESHPFGHAKAEYFSAGVEGTLIFVAAVVIVVSSVERLLRPVPLENVGAGVVVSVIAGVLNGVVGYVLIRAGTAHRSLTLRADGKHLLTDVWTSVGVIVGVLLVALTGFERLDPVVALLVAANIMVTGGRLVGSAVSGLMDHALPADATSRIDGVLASVAREHPVTFHDVRTREAGRHQVVALHLAVPDAWTVRQGHDLATLVEERLVDELDSGIVATHVEPAGSTCERESGPDR